MTISQDATLSLRNKDIFYSLSLVESIFRSNLQLTPPSQFSIEIRGKRAS